jgi:hypothetical protein
VIPAGREWEEVTVVTTVPEYESVNVNHLAIAREPLYSRHSDK